MKILITGAPGTGKTSISKILSQLMNTPYFNVKKIINSHPEVVEKIECKEKIIKPLFKKVLIKELPEDYVIDTHLIEYAPKTDVVVILRCNPIILIKRLEKRKYSKNKIRENLEVELIDYFTQLTKNDKVIEYDTSKNTIKENAEKIKNKIIKKEYNKGSIQWTKKEYFTMLK